jgi:hypothetical protein
MIGIEYFLPELLIDVIKHAISCKGKKTTYNLERSNILASVFQV